MINPCQYSCVLHVDILLQEAIIAIAVWPRPAVFMLLLSPCTGTLQVVQGGPAVAQLLIFVQMN